MAIKIRKLETEKLIKPREPIKPILYTEKTYYVCNKTKDSKEVVFIDEDRFEEDETIYWDDLLSYEVELGDILKFAEEEKINIGNIKIVRTGDFIPIVVKKPFSEETIQELMFEYNKEIEEYEEKMSAYNLKNKEAKMKDAQKRAEEAIAELEKLKRGA